MRYPISIIDSARNLRLQGNTYSDIQKVLKQNFNKSTLSHWFKDLKLTKEQTTILEHNVNKKLIQAQLKSQMMNKERRITYFNGLRDKNIHLLPAIDAKVQKLLLSILYLGEGAKSKSTKHLSLGSSNPNIIKLYLSLLNNCFDIKKEKFRIRVQCRNDQNIEELESFWQKITKISKEQFYPTYIDRRSIGKPTLHKDYKGVCSVIYFDRSIQFELELLADSVIKYIG